MLQQKRKRKNKQTEWENFQVLGRPETIWFFPGKGFLILRQVLAPISPLSSSLEYFFASPLDTEFRQTPAGG